MAPEILCEQPYNEKADVWAVGTIMYCLLGGFNPFEGRSTVCVCVYAFYRVDIGCVIECVWGACTCARACVKKPLIDDLT